LFHGEAHVCAFPKINNHHSATSKVFDTMRTVGGIETRLRSLGLLSYAAFLRERKRSWKKMYLALPLDLLPRRNDPDVTGRDVAEERVASRWM
jgi:hypothetical protein